MPTYVTLVNYTEKGIEMLNDLEPDEVGNMTREVITAHGGELVDFYLTLGEYDAVVVAELPDNQTAAETLLSVGNRGIAETETLTAFTEDELRAIVGNLGG